MRLINRSRKDSPLVRRACDAALARHVERFGDYASRATSSEYTVLVDGMKVKVEVQNRSASYVATAITGARRVRRLAGREF